MAELYAEAKELIDFFGYTHYFMDKEDTSKNYPIKNHNKKALNKSIHNQNEAQEITSIMMNNPKALVRTKVEAHAQKYSTFLTAMRVGIVDKQGKPLSKEEYLKQITLTVSLEAPPKESPQPTETAIKKVAKRNSTPEQRKGKENQEVYVK